MQACARTLHILATLADACSQCCVSPFSDWKQLNIEALVGKVAACMQRYESSITVQITGCKLLGRIPGCSACNTVCEPELLIALGNAGAIQAVVAGFHTLQTRSSEPAAALGASQVLRALSHLTVETVQTNVDLLAAAGGVQLVLAAWNIAKTQGPCIPSALTLLVRLAHRHDVTPEEAMAAAFFAIDVGESGSLANSNVLEAWGFSDTLPSILAMLTILTARGDISKSDISRFMERGAAASVNVLRSAAQLVRITSAESIYLECSIMMPLITYCISCLFGIAARRYFMFLAEFHGMCDGLRCFHGPTNTYQSDALHHRHLRPHC